MIEAVMRLLLLPLLLGLAACDPAVSVRPLVTAGGDQPLPGLWALLDPGCAQPTNGAVQAWPDCATPVWLQPGEATVLNPAPVRSAFVVAAGAPRVLQVSLPAKAGDEPRFGYYAVRTEGAPPHRSATLWLVNCEPERGRTEAADDDAECQLESEAELRRLARAAVEEEPIGRAVYVGPR